MSHDTQVDTHALKVLRRLDETGARLARAEGAAQANARELEAARAQCAEMGVDPDHIDEEIRKIETEIATEVASISAKVDHVSAVLQSVNH